MAEDEFDCDLAALPAGGSNAEDTPTKARGRPKGKAKVKASVSDRDRPERSPKGKPKAKAKGKVKGKIGKDKKSRTYNLFCRCCRKFFDRDGMALKQVQCHCCKRASDCVYHMAKSQDRLTWWTRVRECDEKIFQVISEYKNRFPDAIETGQRRKKNDPAMALQYFEQIICSTKVVRKVEGEMMWEKEYYEFGQSWKGGRLSDDQCRQQWQEWIRLFAADPENPNLHSDMKGPQGFERRFWVKTADKINFEDVQERQKVMKLSDKEKRKDVTQDDIDATYKRIMTGHDKIGHASDSSTLAEVAKAMVKNSAGHDSFGGSAFDADLMELPDVSVLLPDKEDGEEDDGDDGDHKQQEEEEEEEQVDREVKDAEDQDEVRAKDFEKWHKLMLRQKRSVRADNATLRSNVKAMIEKIQENITSTDADPTLSFNLSAELDVVRRSLFVVVVHRLAFFLALKRPFSSQKKTISFAHFVLTLSRFNV